MRTLNLFIIDDDPVAIEHLKVLIAKTPYRFAGSSTDARQAILEIEKIEVDIVFLDMQMQPLSGLDVVPQLPKHVKVIFCTSFREFAHQAYDIYASHYLLKPFGFVRFYDVLSKTVATVDKLSYLGETEIKRKFQFFGSGLKGSYEKFWYNDFVYAQSFGDKTIINFKDGNSHTLNQRIGKLLKKLPTTHFARISNEVFIALHAIDRIGNSKAFVNINGKVEGLDMGIDYAKEIMRWVSDNS